MPLSREGSPILVCKQKPDTPLNLVIHSFLFGFMPIVLALGAESRAPMGVAVIGGITVSLVLSLLIVPAAYLLISKKD